jgi:hypothetical protein
MPVSKDRVSSMANRDADVEPRGSAEPTPGSQAATANAASSRSPSSDAVAGRAYELFMERGASDGHDVDDWLKAEQELSGRE